ncbi:MAG: hypothetical protein AB3N64_05640 [Puniceicoccaceae bacterium]
MATLRKSKTATQRLWRPDFRDVQSLPDTKVIRTGFLLNFIALALALGSITLYGMREYSLQTLIKSVKELEQQVASSDSQNREILDTNKRFRQSAEVVAEAVAFDHQALQFHPFLSQLGESLQEGMVLSVVEMQSEIIVEQNTKLPPFVIQLQGQVLEDAPAKPAQVLSDFQEALLQLPSLQGKGIEMEMAQFSRNNQFGHFDFTLLVKISVEKAPSL